MMTSIPTKLSGNYSETAIDDETVVMSLATGDFFSLTGTARDIWDLIDGARDSEAIIAELAATYGAEPAAVTTDVAEFLDSLRQAGLIAG